MILIEMKKMKPEEVKKDAKKNLEKTHVWKGKATAKPTLLGSKPCTKFLDYCLENFLKYSMKP